jgi:hypothetical protein
MEASTGFQWKASQCEAGYLQRASEMVMHKALRVKSKLSWNPES